MAALADTGVPRLAALVRFASADRGEWLIVGFYGALLAAILVLNGGVAPRKAMAPSDTAVCQQRLPAMLPGLFFVSLH